MLLSLLLVALAGWTGCAEPTGTDDVSVERRLLELALETRLLHEETVEAGRLLVEGRGDEARTVSRLRALSREAREFAGRVPERAPGAPELRSLREAAEQVERGAERLLTFSRFGEPNVLLAGSDALQETDRELDVVARRLDAKLGEDARRELDRLRREVPVVAGAEMATGHHGTKPTGLRPWSVNAMAWNHEQLTTAGTRGQGEPAALF